MKKEEKTLRDHLIIMDVLLFIGTAVVLFASILAESVFSWILLVLGVLVIAVGILYANRHFKCPHCEEKLSPRMGVPSYCPHCGQKLE